MPHGEKLWTVWYMSIYNQAYFAFYSFLSFSSYAFPKLYSTLWFQHWHNTTPAHSCFLSCLILISYSQFWNITSPPIQPKSELRVLVAIWLYLPSITNEVLTVCQFYTFKCHSNFSHQLDCPQTSLESQLFFCLNSAYLASIHSIWQTHFELPLYHQNDFWKYKTDYQIEITKAFFILRFKIWTT